MPQPRSKRHSQAEWEKHRGFILTRFLHEKQTLKQVRQELKEKGFLVSPAQLEYRCKTKWGFDKYLDRSAWQQIGSIVGQRRVEKHSFFWKGQSLKPSRVIKETRRHLPLRSRVSGQLTHGADTPRCEPKWCHVANQHEPLQMTRRHHRSYDLRSSSVYGEVNETEVGIILHFFANNLIKDKHLLHLRDIIDWAYCFVQSFQAANLRADNEDAIFQAATNRLWTLIFQSSYVFETFGHVSDDDDSRLLAVVSWLLATSLESYPSAQLLLDAFACTLASGHVQVARLLWGKIPPNQRSGSYYSPWVLRRTASSRSKEATLLFHEMLPHHARSVVSAVSQYGDMASFSAFLPDLFRLVVLEDSQGDRKIPPRETIALLIAGCARVETERLALSKMQMVQNFLLLNRIQPSEDLVNADAFMAAVSRGYHELFASLVKVNGNPGIRDARGLSALQVAAEFGELKLFNQTLLRSPSGYRSKDSYILTMHAALLSGQLDVLWALDQHMRTFLGDDPKPEKWRETLCSCSQQRVYAMSESKLQRIHKLDDGLFPYTHVSHYLTCILCFTALRACTEGLVQLLDFCLSHGANPDWKNPQAFRTLSSPLDAAVSGTFEGFNHPLSGFSGAFPSTLPDADLRRRWGDVCHPPGPVVERVQCARLLFQEGTIPTSGHLETALFAGEWEMAQVLLESGVIPSKQHLESAICGQNVACIRNMASLLGDHYHPDSLCAAVFFSSDCSLSRKVAFDLLDNRDKQASGAPVESTAIGLAAMRNDSELLRRLLDTIRKPSLLCFHPGIGSYALHVSPDGDEEEIRMMVERIRMGSPFWRFDTKELRSPLGFAVLKYGCQNVLILIAHGFKPDLTACNIAVLRGRSDILSLLLHGQPALFQWPQPYLMVQSPLCSAIRRGNFAIVGQLLSAGANIDGPEGNGLEIHRPLQAAVLQGSLEMVEFLLMRGAQVDTEPLQMSEGSALSLAVKLGRSDVVRLLLDKGADINSAAPKYEWSCIESAADEGRFDIMQLLIEHRVITNGKHRVSYVNALHLAERRGYLFLAQRLRKYGGWTAWDDIATEMIIIKEKHGWLSRQARAEVEVEASLALKRRAGGKCCEAEPPVLQHGGNEPQEALLLHCPSDSPSFPLSPWALVSTELGPQSLEEMVLLTPPLCPLDNDEEWIQQWGPLFLRTQSIQDDLDEEFVNLD